MRKTKELKLIYSTEKQTYMPKLIASIQYKQKIGGQRGPTPPNPLAVMLSVFPLSHDHDDLDTSPPPHTPHSYHFYSLLFFHCFASAIFNPFSLFRKYLLLLSLSSYSVILSALFSDLHRRKRGKK